MLDRIDGLIAALVFIAADPAGDRQETGHGHDALDRAVARRAAPRHDRRLDRLGRPEHRRPDRPRARLLPGRGAGRRQFGRGAGRAGAPAQGEDGGGRQSAALPRAQGRAGRHLDRGRGRARGGDRGGVAAGRMGDGGRRRLCRPGADPGGRAARRHGGARQQGGAGLRRPAADRRRSAESGGGAAAGRFRAQRDLPGVRAQPARRRSIG